jgi:HB1, ASXL, restriction endonuclease HTH domain
LDAYLDIAETVLRVARRPLTPRAIMTAAFRAGIVPTHLFGKAQHKTLQARLSEDILRNKLESRFFRTDPGCFFLSEFRSDPEVPDEYKDPFHARRRTRDSAKESALALDRGFVLGLDPASLFAWERLLREADAVGALKYADSRKHSTDLIFVWAFSVVRRNDQVLSYKVGRYRDNRDAFANRKSIGFAEPVGFNDASLFAEDMGISNCGLHAVLTDLDLSKSAFQKETDCVRPIGSLAFLATGGGLDPVMLFLMEWQCPAWFEPTVRRLSLNEVRWIDATRAPNDIDAFEPWSAIALTSLIERVGERSQNAKADTRPPSSLHPF